MLGGPLGGRPGSRRLSLGCRLLADPFLVAGLGHGRNFSDRAVGMQNQVTKHGVIEPERSHQFIQGFLAALDIHQQIVGLVDLVDRMGELPSTPVFLAMDNAFSALDHASIALQHGGDVFALVRVDQKHDFVVSQLRLPSVQASRVAVRQGVTGYWRLNAT